MEQDNSNTSQGKIVQIIGAVVDAEFPASNMPKIYDALEVTYKLDDSSDAKLVLETQQHLGQNRVRAVAMSSTEGLVRGMDVLNTAVHAGHWLLETTMTPTVMAQSQLHFCRGC